MESHSFCLITCRWWDFSVKRLLDALLSRNKKWKASYWSSQIQLSTWWGQALGGSFGVLVARWRLFRKPIRADKENITSYILAGVAPPNYLQQTEDVSYCPRGFVDFKANGEFRPGGWRRMVCGDTGCFMPCWRYRGSRYENNAIKMRDDLKDYVSSDIGSLPWKLNYVQRTGRVSDRDWL